MIELYQFRPKFNVPNLSPFCLKLETWLKMAGLDYQSRYLDDPRKAPLGKLPYIKDGQTEVTDSSCVIDYLTRKYQVQLDAHLSAEQKAIAHSCKIMIEERLYWVLVYHRWLGEAWPMLKDAVFSRLPPVVRSLAPIMVQAKLRRDMQGHGIGKHSEAQMNAFAEEDLESLAQLLGDKVYFFGEQPCSFDAILFATLCEHLHSSLSTPLKAMTERHQNLVAYQTRMGKQFFPDYYDQD